jgi:hypothetical protein
MKFPPRTPIRLLMNMMFVFCNVHLKFLKSANF